MTKVLFLILLFICNFANTQLPTNSFGIPAGRAYKLQGKSEVYLIAEVHDFYKMKESDIDYKYGFELYYKAQTVYIEPHGADGLDKSTARRSTRQLVSDKTNSRIEDYLNEIRSLLVKKNLRTETLDAFDKNLFDSSPDSTWALLIILRAINNLLSGKKIEPSAPGLGAKLRLHEKKNNVTKLKAIEKYSIGASIWSADCDNRADAEDLIESILDKNLSVDPIVNAQLNLSFVDPKINLDYAHARFLQFPGAKALQKCNIEPRNRAWATQIIHALEAQGGPVVFVLGAGHFAGDQGILKLLHTAGYTNIKKLDWAQPINSSN